MATLQPVRGTHDLLPADAAKHNHVVATARTLGQAYGYGEIATPIFEQTEVFKRTLGDTSDVVTKEMYTFEDKGGDSVTLRPEGTAAVARAFISGKMGDQLPLKFFYHGPMFRYERPQKGRQRQFHQIGVELFGVADPVGDVEVIALGAQILERLGVRDWCTLELNTLGDTESRNAYRTALVAYFQGHLDRLSDDSRDRLHRNPLRILDSKDQRDRAAIEDAPRFDDYLTPAARDFFARVQEGLSDLGIAFTRNERLVRGLDYYCHTAFEFTTDRLGSQSAVLAGGRYDGLIGTMGGPETPGVGWAAGIERLAMLAEAWPEAPRPVAFIPLGAAADKALRRVAFDLRGAGFAIDMGYSGNLKRRLNRANKANARLAVIVGDDELAAGQATVRNMDTGEQQSVPLADLALHLKD
ncbi:MAG: histidine--tRNA ligase [Alphaproteobacteria bacterium]|nr:histidine--tRNA ligase [Alphaproteobacteria bacterium]